MAEITLAQFLEQVEKLNTTLREWKDEVRQLAVDYNNDLKTVEETIKRLDRTEKKFWNVYKNHIVALVATLLFVGAVFTISKINFCGTLDLPFGTYTGKSCDA